MLIVSNKDEYKVDFYLQDLKDVGMITSTQITKSIHYEFKDVLQGI